MKGNTKKSGLPPWEFHSFVGPKGGKKGGPGPNGLGAFGAKGGLGPALPSACRHSLFEVLLGTFRGHGRARHILLQKIGHRRDWGRRRMDIYIRCPETFVCLLCLGGGWAKGACGKKKKHLNHFARERGRKQGGARAFLFHYPNKMPTFSRKGRFFATGGGCVAGDQQKKKRQSSTLAHISAIAKKKFLLVSFLGFRFAPTSKLGRLCPLRAGIPHVLLGVPVSFRERGGVSSIPREGGVGRNRFGPYPRIPV